MSRREPSTLTLVLNPILCDGRGMCHEAAPELISLDEWGYPLLPGDGLRAAVPHRDRRTAEDATHACPVLALHIERSPRT